MGENLYGQLWRWDDARPHATDARLDRGGPAAICDHGHSGSLLQPRPRVHDGTVALGVGSARSVSSPTGPGGTRIETAVPVSTHRPRCRFGGGDETCSGIAVDAWCWPGATTARGKLGDSRRPHATNLRLSLSVQESRCGASPPSRLIETRAWRSGVTALSGPGATAPRRSHSEGRPFAFFSAGRSLRLSAHWPLLSRFCRTAPGSNWSSGPELTSATSSWVVPQHFAGRNPTGNPGGRLYWHTDTRMRRTCGLPTERGATMSTTLTRSGERKRRQPASQLAAVDAERWKGEEVGWRALRGGSRGSVSSSWSYLKVCGAQPDWQPLRATLLAYGHQHAHAPHSRAAHRERRDYEHGSD